MQNRALILTLLAIGSAEAGLFSRFSGLSRSFIPKVAAPIAVYLAGVKSLKAEDVAAKKPDYPHWRFRNSPGVQATQALIALSQCLGTHREHLSVEDKKRYSDALEVTRKLVRVECSGPASHACQALVTASADGTMPKMTYPQARAAAEEGIQVVHELYQKQWDENHLKKRFDALIPLSFDLDAVVERYSSYGDPYFDPQHEQSAGVRAYKAIPKLFPYCYNYDTKLSPEEKARHTEALVFMRRVAERDCSVNKSKNLQCLKALKYGIDEASSHAHDLESAQRLAEEAVEEARSLRFTPPGAIVTAQQAIKTITRK